MFENILKKFFGVKRDKHSKNFNDAAFDTEQFKRYNPYKPHQDLYTHGTSYYGINYIPPAEPRKKKNDTNR